jgi:hypothetical protein
LWFGRKREEKKENERIDIEMREIREKNPHSCAVLHSPSLSLSMSPSVL